jgi:hypothetical protein
MADGQRTHKPRERSQASKSDGPSPPAQVPAAAPAAPAWMAAPAAAPFSLGGVQRKVAIGESNDAYERQADQVAGRVVSGGNVPPGSISPIAPASLGPSAQREAKPAEKKKDEKTAAPPIQREVKPEDTKKDIKAAGAELQRQAKPDETKKDEKPAAPPPVQKQAKPEKKKDDKAAAAAPVQKQAKPEEKKKEEKPAAAPPVQKQSKPEEKKIDDKAAAAATVQKQAKPEEKKKDDKPAAAPVQRSVRPEDKKKEEVPGTLPVQRAGTEQAAERDEEPVQTSRGGGGAAATPSMQSAAANAIASKGPGEPLSSSTRGTLESSMGSDLSDVRVHNDTQAHEAANTLNARAFTHQNDIWLGSGESQSDTRLMAHEATHVVQQTGSVHRHLVQAAPKDKPAAGTDKPIVPPGPVGTTKTGLLDPATKQIQFDSLDVPAYKATRYGGKTLKRKANYKRDDPDPNQRSKWKKEIKTKDAADKLAAKAKKSQANTKPEHIFSAKTKHGAGRIFFGDLDTIAREATLPSWNAKGEGHSYDVDHILELQLANWSDDKSANELDNMELLDSEMNQATGNTIKTNIEKKVDKFIEKEGGSYGSLTHIKEKYALVFNKANPAGGPALTPDKHWTRDQIESGVHIGPPKGGPVQASDASVLGKKGQAKVFPSAAGGQAKTFNWPGDIENKEKSWLYPFELIGKSFETKDEETSTFGKLTFRIPKSDKLLRPIQRTITVQRVEGARYAGFIEKQSVIAIFRDLHANGLSPIETDEVEINEDGLHVTGRIKPEIDLLRGTSINFEINGTDIRVYKTFEAADFKAPKPLTISDSSFTISAGNQSGLQADGEIHFGIDKVGKGFLKGRRDLSDGLELSGEFDFDTKTFKPATVKMEYKKEELSVTGIIGIPEKRVTGIKKADLTVNYSAGKLTATGNAEFTVPGVEKGAVEASYSEADGFIISGSLTLNDKIPGISSGSIEATVKEKEGKYSVKAHGEATPKIPGITSKLVVNYDDGLFDASITAGYEKGMLKGIVTVGATNRPVGDDGKPAAGAPEGKADKLTIYGSGSATLKLSPRLQATAGIRFLPTGEVEVTGEIALTKPIDLFEEKSVEKVLMEVHTDIPIFGVSALGHTIGIALEIGGNLKASAGIGPGQLQDLSLSVKYNPAHEEETTVHGHAALDIPAHAGLRLGISANLVAGIPIVDAKAGLEIGGELDIVGGAHADLDVDWSPQKGLVLDAEAKAHAQPKFKFDITGSVLVELDLWVKTITLYEHKWELYSKEFGSGLDFELSMPVHYEEGKPLNVAYEDFKLKKPDIDPIRTLKNVFDEIV